MASPERVRLIGATASPYTQKMVALLRYRRIPYAVTWGDPGRHCDALGVERPRPVLMPTFIFEDEGHLRARCDSTPIIRDLDARYPARVVVPRDPSLAFIDYLIEDFADEWCTKYMFHYRWHERADADNAGTLLPLSMDVSMDETALAQFKSAFTQRQIDRLYVVGSSEDTAPVIDASFRRFLQAMEQHLATQPFMLGARPSAGDFGLYGQLTQLVGFDPTPRAITHALSPRAVAWVDLLRDQSGLEPSEDDWVSIDAQPDSLRALLSEIGRVYVPALLANAAAAEAGQESWEATIDGTAWTQQTFPYQAKCLKWIREEYRVLSAPDRSRVDRLLAGTGVEALLRTL